MALQMSTKNLDKKRWISIVAAMVLMSTLSLGYTWSLLVDPMITERGATNEFMAACYSGLTISGMIFTLIGGKMVDKIGSTKTNVFSMVCLIIGFLMCGLTHNIWAFAIAQVIFIGFQESVVYIAVFNTATGMFPDHRGLATGLASAGISLGGMIISPLYQSAIDTFGFDGSFLIMGIAITIYGFIAIVFLPDCPKGYKPASFDPEAAELANKKKVSRVKANPNFVQKGYAGMFKDPAFYVLFAIPLLCSTGYMLLAYQMSYIAQDILSITPMQASFLVSGVAAMGFAAKLIGGPIGDRIGRLLWVAIVLCLGTVFIAGLIFSADHGFVWFAVCSLGYCFCLGTFAGATGAITGDLFGSEHFGTNFSVVYMSVLLASAISPWLAVMGRSGEAIDYGPTFTLCTVMCACGAALAVVLYFMRRNKTEYLFRTKEEMAAAQAEIEAASKEN